MSTRAQKDKLLQLKVKDKKTSRLISHQDLSNSDILTLNQIQQQRMNLSFWYNVLAPLMVATTLNFTLFKLNTTLFRTSFFVLSGVSTHIMIKRLINRRYDSLMNPYFEKYKVK